MTSAVNYWCSKKKVLTSEVDTHKWTHAKSTVSLKTVVKQHSCLLLGHLFF